MTVVGEAGRVLALDWGDRRIGVAVSDRSRTMAFPREHLTVVAQDDVISVIEQMVIDEEITCVVIGDPVSLSGGETESTKKVRKQHTEIAQRLAARGVEVLLVDERFTTREASRRLHEGGSDHRAQRSRIDSAAAAVLLQHVLEDQL